MKTPMLRFKADDGSDFPTWEEKMLGEIIREYREYHEKDGTYEHVSLTKDGVISKTERYDRDYLVKCVDKKYRVTHMNDICYNPANLKFGVICRNTYGDGIFSPIYVTYRVNESYDPIFIEALVVRDAFIQQALRFQEGTVYERMSVSPSDFESMFVSVPSLPEQRKIADLLSAVDDVIAAQEAEVAAWEKRKKGVMQKLFSQEVRFKADDGSDFPDWEEKTLGDICMYERQRSEGANFVGTENMLKDFGGVTFDNSNADGLGTLYHPGDTLMSNIRPYLKKAWLADRKGTCSTDVLVFHPTSVDPGYLYWLIASDAFVRYVMSAAKGSKMPRGDKKHIMEMPLLLPNKDEQCKIDDCLSSLNDVIIKAKNELAKWQELKKGLLQQMFV